MNQEGINNLEQLEKSISNITKLLQVYGDEAKNIEKARNVLQEDERLAREFEKMLEEKNEKLNERQNDLDTQQKYIEKLSNAVNLKKTEIEENGKKENIKLLEKKLEIEEKLKLLKSEEKRMDKKRVSFDELEDKETDVLRRESLIDKQIAIDRERKKMLDIRQEKIDKKIKELKIEDTIK